MPAAVCPCFHCRPSTTNTLLLPSASIRQPPTTLKNDFGSAPTVSSEKSILSGSTAYALGNNVIRPITVAAAVSTRFVIFMVDLHVRWVARGCVEHAFIHGVGRNIQIAAGSPGLVRAAT